MTIEESGEREREKCEDLDGSWDGTEEETVHSLARDDDTDDGGGKTDAEDADCDAIVDKMAMRQIRGSIYRRRTVIASTSSRRTAGSMT